MMIPLNMMGGYGPSHHDMMHNRGGQYGMMTGGCAQVNPTSTKEQQVFLDQTRETRRKLHGLMFDYMEAVRVEKPDQDAVEKLQAEIKELQAELTVMTSP